MPETKCYLCGSPVVEGGLTLYHQPICPNCVLKKCIRCEWCGALAVTWDSRLLKYREGTENKWYHKDCWDEKVLLDRMKRGPK